jgi:hypothetical protein
MSDPKNSTAVYLIPGMSAKFLAIDAYISPKDSAKFPDANGRLVDLPLVQGFAVLYADVGAIEEVPNEPAVKYTHKKFSMNKIYFLSRTGERGIVDVISVPIHDHSSIVTGGPAYGTYFTDDETSKPKED